MIKFLSQRAVDDGFVQVRVIPDLTRRLDDGDILGKYRAEDLKLPVASGISEAVSNSHLSLYV